MFEKIAVISSSKAPIIDFLPQGVEVLSFTANSSSDFPAAIREAARGEDVSLAIIVTDPGEPREEQLLLLALKSFECPVWDHRRKNQDSVSRIAATVNPFRKQDEVERHELRVLRVADGLASWLEADLHVVHAWKAQAEGRVRTRMKEITFESTMTDVEPSVLLAVKKTIKAAGLDLADDRICLSRGHPAATLPSCIRDLDVNIVVTGYSARTLLARSVIHDTGLGLLRDFERDLVFVKPL